MKKLIIQSLLLPLTAIVSIAVSCNLNSKKEETSFEVSNIKFKNHEGKLLDFQQTLLSDVKLENIVFEASNFDNLKYFVQIEKINKDDKNSSLEILFNLKQKDDNKTISSKTITISSFKKLEVKLSLDQYLKLSAEERFKYDNENYYQKALTRIRVPLEKYRPNLIRNKESIKRYNQKAEKLGLDSFENSLVKNFSLPSLDNKLQMFEGSRAIAASEHDSLDTSNKYLIGGLARKLINSKYKDIALQTYGISFVNRSPKTLQERVNALDSSFKQTLEKLATYYEQMQDFEKKDLVVWINDVYAKANILLNLSKQESDDLFSQANKIVKNYIDRLKEAKNYQFLANKSFLDFSINPASNWEIYQQEEYKIFTPDNYSITNSQGTMWILDAQIDPNNNYPTKFYFGTNAHVADALSKNTVAINISRANDSIEINKQLKPNENDEHFETFSFQLQEYEDLKEPKTTPSFASDAFSIIFSAKDFLKSKPSDFLINSQAIKYKEAEEFADFAIIEIDFNKIKNISQVEINTSQDSGYSIPFKDKHLINTPFDLAKLFTNNYASKANESKRVKLLSKDYLHNYNKIDNGINKPIDQDKDSLFILGYPSTQFDYFLKLGERRKLNEKYLENAALKQSLWTNVNADYDIKDNINQEYGERLSSQVALRTFRTKMGIIDAFLATPNDNGTGFYIDPNSKQFINMGLQYTPRFYAPGGGASGSSLRNQNNELVGVFHYKYGRFAEIGTGLAAAFRSAGFDYDGLFGSYNLPQYDLIYGNGKDQKNSYREQLYKKYGNVKTFLMPNGTNEENIPNEFKFNKTDE